jgi:hypothetical protein
MQCWNCGKDIPEAAKACQFCEAPVEEQITSEEEQMARQVLDMMGPEAMDALQKAVAESSTAEEFVNRIMVGECPKCGSDETGDCDQDPEIENILVGRCFACGQLWCTECDRLLDKENPDCPCWEED